MQIAIGTCFDYRVPIEQQLAQIAVTPFRLISLGGDSNHSGYLTTLGRFRLTGLAEEHGIAIDSLHAPYGPKHDISYSDSESRMASVCRIALAMAAAVELDAKTVILHLQSWPVEAGIQDVDSLLRSLEALVESAENMKMRLAAENLPGKVADVFLRRALAEFKSDYFGFCYDSSHDQLGPGKPYEVLEEFANRLFAVHLSDNDGLEDRHWIPFTGIVDWERVCYILHEARYSQPLLLEVENNDHIPTEEFLSKSAAAAIRLQTLILS
jgi:sugar phosphate isomerase/epimerase